MLDSWGFLHPAQSNVCHSDSRSLAIWLEGLVYASSSRVVAYMISFSALLLEIVAQTARLLREVRMSASSRSTSGTPPASFPYYT